MRPKELILPRNVPPENFSSSWNASSETNCNCSSKKIFVYVVTALILSIIVSIGVYLIIHPQLLSQKAIYQVKLCNKPETCDKNGEEPVCGSDGVIVSNL